MSEDRRRVLLVEDDRHSRQGYAEYLRLRGFEVVEASTGAQALEAAFGSRPGVIVTDISLPELDGFALAQKLRADARTSQIPIVGMTAHWDTEVSARAAAASFATLLLKPCQPDHLAAEIDRALAHAPAA